MEKGVGIVQLAVEDVAVRQGKCSISHVNFTLEGGDIFGLMGRSGSGKSTLLKTMLGEIRPTKGKIKASVNGVAVKLHDILGYAPQHHALFVRLTVQENLYTFGNLRGIASSTIKKRIDELLPQLGIHQTLPKYISELSGGMQKRVDVACALITRPKILILDEPFNGLDVSLQQFIWDLLVSLAAAGSIIIVTSHLIRDLEKHCSALGLIENGYYYDTTAIKTSMKQSKDATLDLFIQRLFASKGNEGTP